MNCDICSLDSARHVDTVGTTVEVECPRCGRYKHTSVSYMSLMWAPNEKRPIISSWIWEQNQAGIIPTITADNLSTILSSQPLPFFEKAKRLLLYMADESRRLGQPIAIGDLRIGPMLQTFDSGDISFVATFLEQQNWAQRPTGSPDFRVTGPGFVKADELRRVAPTSNQGFVAMSFDKTLDSAWHKGFAPAIRAAGYRPFRIDGKDFVGGITDEIMSEIRRSKFVIADYTGQANGVYFEAGFALRLGLTLIPTCRAEEVAKLHFDIKHLNTLLWNAPQEIEKQLATRIRAVVGMGPISP